MVARAIFSPRACSDSIAPRTSLISPIAPASPGARRLSGDGREPGGFSLEPLPAAGRAEIVRAPVVGRTVPGCRDIHAHAADRVDRFVLAEGRRDAPLQRAG